MRILMSAALAICLGLGSCSGGVVVRERASVAPCDHYYWHGAWHLYPHPMHCHCGEL